MSEYNHYIDKGAIQLADLAFEIEDFECAKEHYFKAYYKLENYKGIDSPLLLLKGEISFKLKE